MMLIAHFESLLSTFASSRAVLLLPPLSRLILRQAFGTNSWVETAALHPGRLR